MLNYRKLILILATGCCLLSVAPLWAQEASLIDTFRVLDTVAMPGETLPVQFYLANDSLELAAMAAYFKIDNSVLEWVGEWDSVFVPPTFLIKYDTLPRADIPNLFNPIHIFMISYIHDSGVEFGVMTGAGIHTAIPKGSGPIYQFYVKVKESVPVGTQTLIEPFDPIDLPPFDDSRFSQFSDQFGELYVEPTLVAGTLEVIAVAYGDANRDGSVNISDAVALIHFVFDDGEPPNPVALGDANCDGAVNITDVVYIIDYVFNGGPAPGDC
ncbi:MAG: dockerin type I repeat-containing protein [bacterium]